MKKAKEEAKRDKDDDSFRQVKLRCGVYRKRTQSLLTGCLSAGIAPLCIWPVRAVFLLE